MKNTKHGILRKTAVLTALAVLLFSVFVNMRPTASAAETYTISAENEAEVLAGNIQLTYSLFGAKGDGVSNDYEAVKAAHEWANRHYTDTLDAGEPDMITVYGDPGYKYYLSFVTVPIDIVTNVDWQGCTFILDDYADTDGDGINDINFSEPVFDVVSDMKADIGWAVTLEYTDPAAGDNNNDPKGMLFKKLSDELNLGPDSTNVYPLIEAVKSGEYYTNQYRQKIRYDMDRTAVWGAYVENNDTRWIRKGNNQINRTGELITFDSRTGELLTGVDFEYDDLYQVKVFPIRNEGISIGNATFVTRTNNQVYMSASRSRYSYRGIRVRYTGNVAIHNISHVLDETAHPYSGKFQTDPNANCYFGFISLFYGAYIEIDSVDLAAHTASLKYGSTENYEGSYDLTAENIAFLYLDRLGYGDYEQDVTGDSRWGTVATNQTKGVFVSNSTVNRIDAHRGITDLYIKDSVIGVKGLTVDGQGTFYAENVVFDKAVMPLQLRQDYGASWNGNMYFRDITCLLKNDVTSYIVYAYNTENWNFGYRSWFPDLYIDGLTLMAEEKTEPVLFLFSDTVGETIDDSSPDNLYYFKGNIKVSGLTTRNIPAVDAFSFFFPKDETNLSLGSYGGTNKVTLDLDEKIEINGDLNIESPKFVTGTVKTDFASPREYLEDLYAKGRKVLNSTWTSVDAETVEIYPEKIEMFVGDVSLVSAKTGPAGASRAVDYISSDEKVVTVGENGKLKAVGTGTAVITAVAGRETVSNGCTVTVLPHSAPFLSSIYNSAGGADIRWRPMPGVTTYYIMRKTNGVWESVAEVEASDLETAGSDLKYIDSGVADRYGKGFIYSVAVSDGEGGYVYDKLGLPLYRLKQPVINAAYMTSDTTAYISWSETDCHGYELQYSSDSGGSWIKMPETVDTGITVKGLDPDLKYIFRVRCQKTNPDRGTTWSQYSSWAKAGTLTAPKLTAIYNSSEGADLRWEPVEGATAYFIMRKENGVWKEIKRVNGREFTMDGGKVRYIDSSIKGSPYYGKGFIYSVAATDGQTTSPYDMTGLPLYRLNQPKILSVEKRSESSVTVTWRQETCDGYELQYSCDGGKTWVKADETEYTYITLYGLDHALEDYVFRVRTERTNKDRGTIWSQYSDWSRLR